MELIFIFAVIHLQIFLLHFFEIMEIVRTLGIDTFVYTEELAVFLGNQGIAAMRTGKSDGSSDHFAGRESLSADLALVLTISAIVIVDVMVRGTA